MTANNYHFAFRTRTELMTIAPRAGTTVIALSRDRLSSETVGETDLIRFATSLAREVHRVSLGIGRCLTSRTSSTLFLLTSGGLVVYLLLRWKGQEALDSQGSDDPDVRGTPTDPHGGGFSASRCLGSHIRSWLRWLFEDELMDGPNHDFLVEGEYFGPAEGSTTPPGGSGFRRGFRFNIRPNTHQREVPKVENADIKAVYVAPCPNCLKGCCKLRRHHLPSSVNTTPKACNNNTVTPYNADDEHSDVELEDNDFSFTNVQMNSTKIISSPRRRQRRQSNGGRIPPEGKEKAMTNLSCGDEKCQDSFCLSQMSRLQREESFDSMNGVSGSMVDLVKGAREIRRMIRETSLDSVSSDLSLCMGFNEDIGGSVQEDMDRLYSELSMIRTSCDDMTENLNYLPEVYHTIGATPLLSKSDYSLVQRDATTTTSDQETLDGSSPDLRKLKLKRSGVRKLWRLSANISDLDSPRHKGTTDEESNWEWESPVRGWHDFRPNKYKVALSRSASIVTSENEDNVDPWEWDSEGMGHEPQSYSNFHLRGHESWLPESTNLELDLEKELNSSRRSSLGSDVSINSIRNLQRLPPSGRSSVAKGSSPSMTPSTSMDKDMMNLSLNTGYDPAFVINRFTTPSKYYRCRRTGSVGSSDESGVQDLEKSFESSQFTCVTTPLSPVHEAKEPRSSPLSSPSEEKVGLLTERRFKVKRKLSMDKESLPDLELVTPT